MLSYNELIENYIYNTFVFERKVMGISFAHYHYFQVRKGLGLWVFDMNNLQL